MTEEAMLYGFKSIRKFALSMYAMVFVFSLFSNYNTGKKAPACA
jgi:hypothetical protein